MLSKEGEREIEFSRSFLFSSLLSSYVVVVLSLGVLRVQYLDYVGVDPSQSQVGLHRCMFIHLRLLYVHTSFYAMHRPGRVGFLCVGLACSFLFLLVFFCTPRKENEKRGVERRTVRRREDDVALFLSRSLSRQTQKERQRVENPGLSFSRLLSSLSSFSLLSVFSLSFFLPARLLASLMDGWLAGCLVLSTKRQDADDAEMRLLWGNLVLSMFTLFTVLTLEGKNRLLIIDQRHRA